VRIAKAANYAVAMAPSSAARLTESD